MCPLTTRIGGRTSDLRKGLHMTTDANDESNFEDELRAKLVSLTAEHRDLDLVIRELTRNPPSDELLMRRLKKRKLLLKDKISLLERMLDPAEPA